MSSANPANTTSIWVVLLYVMSLIPHALSVFIFGPKRANRTRLLEFTIRTSRSLFGSKGLNVHQARYIFTKLNDHPPPDADAEETDPCKYEVVSFNAVLNGDRKDHKSDVVHVNTSLTDTKKVSLNTPWNVNAEWITPKKGLDYKDRIILYIHGGGFMFNSALGYRGFLGPAAMRLKRRIFSLDYQLSPESQFPGALHQAVAAYMYLINHAKFSPQNIIIMGDSAGGNLAMAATLFIRNHDLPQCGGTILISPFTDLSSNLPSIQSNKEYDLIEINLENPEMNPVRLYLGPDQHSKCTEEELMSPALVKPTRRLLPPLYVVSGQDEVLIDDHILLAANIAHRGTSQVVVHDIFVNQFHIFPIFTPESIDAAKYWDRVEQFINLYADGATHPETPGTVSQVSQIKDGAVHYHGLKDTWLCRWDGIMAEKGIAWVPKESMNKVLF